MKTRCSLVLIVACAAGYALAKVSVQPLIAPPTQLESMDITTSKQKGIDLYCSNGGADQSYANCYINCGAGQDAAACQDCCETPADCPCP